MTDKELNKLADLEEQYIRKNYKRNEQNVSI